MPCMYPGRNCEPSRIQVQRLKQLTKKTRKLRAFVFYEFIKIPPNHPTFIAMLNLIELVSTTLLTF